MDNMEQGRNIQLISWISLLINCSNLIVFSYFGIYLKTSLMLSFTALGVLEGFVDGMNYFVKLLSGVFFDRRVHNGHNPVGIYRMGIIAITLIKIVESTARTLPWLFGGKIIERIGNALQATPRDSLMSVYTNGMTVSQKFKSFSKRVMFGSIGCLLGSILAGVLYYFLQDYQMVFLCSLIPGVMASYLAIKLYKNYKAVGRTNNQTNNQLINLKQMLSQSKLLTKDYYKILLISSLCSIFRISDTMGILYCFKHSQSPAWCTPFYFAVFHIGAITSAYLIGTALSKKIVKSLTVLQCGLFTFIIAILNFLFLSFTGSGFLSSTGCYLGMLCLGAYSVVCSSVFPAQISEVTKKDLLGTAHGIYNLCNSICLLLGGGFFGLSCDVFGMHRAFAINIVMCIACLVVLGQIYATSKK